MSAEDLFWVNRELGVALARYARVKVAHALGELVGSPPTIVERRSVDGAFVTITLGQQLRGCMGYVGLSQPLLKAVERAAMAAAFDDPRFPPLTQRDFRSSVFEVTILGRLRPLESREPQNLQRSLKLGLHGLLVRRKGLSGLLLPQVAIEYGWGPQEFLSQTCLKAGLPADCWRQPETEVYFFEGKWYSEND
ncbi:MAG: AmmeMemoRadiSam system protein A [Thermoprotei archaeon]